jgi:hypothetical protein
MNLVVNDLDMPLIIKVASIPKERIQVYFIDNDDISSARRPFTDEEGQLYPDNDERAIFLPKCGRNREETQLGSRHHPCPRLDGIYCRLYETLLQKRGVVCQHENCDIGIFTVV